MRSRASGHSPALIWEEFDDIRANENSIVGRQQLNDTQAARDGSFHGIGKGKGSPPSIVRSEASRSPTLKPLPFSRLSSVRLTASPTSPAYCPSVSFTAPAGSTLVPLESPSSCAETSDCCSVHETPHSHDRRKQGIAIDASISSPPGCRPLDEISLHEPSTRQSQENHIDLDGPGPKHLTSTELASTPTSSIALYQVGVLLSLSAHLSCNTLLNIGWNVADE